MSKKTVAIEDIVDTHEITTRLGLRRFQVIHGWIMRGVFPEPIKTLRKDTGNPIRLWNWPAIKEWADAYQGDLRRE